MTKQQLIEVLTPLVKKIVKETLLEEKGVLSRIVSECVSGVVKTQVLTENKREMFSSPITEQRKPAAPAVDKQKILETKRKLLDAIGKDAYNGVNIFEGTAPMTGPSIVQESSPVAQSPLSIVAPEDPGVDIDSLLGGNSGILGKINLMMENRKKKG